MTEELLKRVRPVWESDRYDVPLQGHAWYDGKYGTFGIINFGSWGDDEPPRYSFFACRDLEHMAMLMAERQLFEDMVGHHCTYATPGHYNKNKALDFDWFYGREGRERHPLRDFTEKFTAMDGEYLGDFEFGSDEE